MVPVKLMPQSEQGMCFAFVCSSCSSDICMLLCMHVCNGMVFYRLALMYPLLLQVTEAIYLNPMQPMQWTGVDQQALPHWCSNIS